LDDKRIEPSDSNAAQNPRKSAIAQVAGTALPLEVGSVGLGKDGHIEHAAVVRSLNFRFSACGVDFEADLASRTAPLRLRANLGKLPYSAQSPDGRRLARTVMAATDRLRHGHILLSADHDMILVGEIAPPSPRTPVNVIATAVALILDFKPYLDLLAEAIALRQPAPQLPTDENTDPATVGATDPATAES
jgi:hypothetical protein